MTREPQTELGLRERKKRAQRQAIYNIALSEFRNRGFDTVTVQEIAAEANISLKTFFNYFPSKQAILDECVEQLLAGFVTVIDEYTHDKRRSFKSRLSHLVQEMASALEADRDFWRMIFQESKLFNASGTIKDDEMEVYAHVTAFFREGQKTGDVKTSLDPQQLAEIFFSIYYFTALNWLADWWPKKQSLTKRLDQALAVFLQGALAADPT